MQGDLIDCFRPCGAQARVGDRHRRNSSRCGVRVKADAAQCAHRKAVRSGDGLLLGEQGQVYCAGIVCFVPQGDALFADRYAAAVGGKPRDGRVRARQFAGDAIFLGAHLPGSVFRAGQLLHAVKGGQVVPCALHRPDLIPLRAEGLFGVALHSDIDEKRSSVLVHGNAAGIVVVVAVAVGAKLCTQHPAALPCGINAYTGIPFLRESAAYSIPSIT